MQTKFDEDGLPLATNHAGWNVECLEGRSGWKAVDDPYNHKWIATILMNHYQDKYPDREFRVYEALT